MVGSAPLAEGYVTALRQACVLLIPLPLLSECFLRRFIRLDARCSQLIIGDEPLTLLPVAEDILLPLFAIYALAGCASQQTAQAQDLAAGVGQRVKDRRR